MIRKTLLWTLLLVLLLGGGVGGYSYYTGNLAIPGFQIGSWQFGGIGNAQAQTLQQQQVISTTVTSGDLVIRVNGVGNLLAAQEIRLGFGASGVVKSVAVQPGDRVGVGHVLAMLDDTAVRQQVTEATTTLRQAELQLAQLTQPTAAAIASARANLAAAQAELTQLTTPPTASQLAAARSDLASAQQTLADLLSGIDPNQQTALQADVRSAEVAQQKAQSDYDKVAWRPAAEVITEATALAAAKIAYEKATAEYNLALAGPADSAVSAARAQVSKAEEALNQLQQGADPDQIAASEATVAAAQAQLDNLLNGGDPNAVQNAQLTVQQAQDTLQARLFDLTSTVITTPVTGTVTAVEITVGQQAGGEPVISVAETASSQVRFWVDEVDASKLALDEKVNITFGAYPQLTYTGAVVRIDPTLVTVGNAATVQIWASIDLNQFPGNTLLYGMNADVEVIAGEARNALIVPVQALRELTPGQFAAFVVQPNGELELRPVEVGLQDVINAQILTGLVAGEYVSLASGGAGNTGFTQGAP